MKSVADRKKDLQKQQKHIIHLAGAFVILICILLHVFIHIYMRYTDEVLYEERLGQMREVTEQLFVGLEDTVNSMWYSTDVHVNRIEADKPVNVEELKQYLSQQSELSKHESLGIRLVLVDDHGRYYTQYGEQGLLAEMALLQGAPERVSFVSSAVTKDSTRMFFLERLPEPIIIQNGSRTANLIYCGVARDMNQLNQYFDCKAYNSENAVYVLDDDGSKLFAGENASDYLEGYNAYNILRKADYLHGTTFEVALNELEQNGISYSNAVLNGRECYYALYKMQDSAWTLLFMVPSASVATSAVQLVRSTTAMITLFAACMVLLCGICIYWILRRQQRMLLNVAEENNEALEANNQKLQAAQAATKAALQTAEAANRAKTEFLSNMSHDIRTPMNAIVGIATLMQAETTDPDKLREHIEKLQGSSQHLLSLINDILDMNKIEAGKSVLHNESMTLAEQIGQVETIIRPQAREKNQSLQIRTEHVQHENVIGDPTRLRQILLNILSNAVKYTNDGGNIEMLIEEVPRDGHYARYRFTISDNGIGMTPEFMEHLYDSFSRAENSVTNKVQGTGLGMAITKSIVEMMGGTIHAESTLGKGSRFEVVLDFHIDKQADAKIQKMQVIVLDGSPTALAQIVEAVRGKPIELKPVYGVDNAVAQLLQNHYDAVLTGHSNDPAQLDENKKMREAAPDIILIGVGAFPHDEVLDQLPAVGLDGYVSMPFFVTNMEAEIRRVRENRMAKPEETPEAPLQGMRFLCAEDNALNAEILTALMEMVGATCTIYSDGAQIVKAFETVKEGEYDVILMDVQMPVMNGLDATRAIRNSKNPLGKTIPIIAMTANAFSDDIQRCMDAGMDAHLSKPVNMEEMERTIKRFREVGGGKRYSVQAALR